MRKIIDKVLLKYAYDDDGKAGDLSSGRYRSHLAEELVAKLSPYVRRQWRTDNLDWWNENDTTSENGGV